MSDYSNQGLPPLKRLDDGTIEIRLPEDGGGEELDPGTFDAVTSARELIDFQIVRLQHRELYLRFILAVQPSSFVESALLAVRDDLEFAVLGRDKLRGLRRL